MVIHKLEDESPEPRPPTFQGHLVSSPPLATDHKLRLRRLARDVALQPQAEEGQPVDE